MECRIGSAIIGKKEKSNSWKIQKTLATLQEELNLNLEEMLLLVGKHLKKESYSLKEISVELEIEEDEIIKCYFTRSNGSIIKISDNNYKLHDRC
jgi:hypothetical protein